MSEFMRVYCMCDTSDGSLSICKRHTGDYIVFCDTEEEGVIDILLEGTKSQCFNFIYDRIMKFHENHAI